MNGSVSAEFFYNTDFKLGIGVLMMNYESKNVTVVICCYTEDRWDILVKVVE